MNNLLIVTKDDLIVDTHTINNVDWVNIKREIDTTIYNNIIFMNDTHFKILKCRNSQHIVGFTSPLTNIKQTILKMFTETPEMKAVKELMEIAKKYNVCILTATQTFIPSVCGDVTVLDRQTDCIYVEVVKPRECSGQNQPLFHVQNLWKK